MLDLHPRNDARHVALVNGTVSAAGLGLGALASSLLVQFSPAPRVVPFVLVTALIGVLLASARPRCRSLSPSAGARACARSGPPSPPRSAVRSRSRRSECSRRGRLAACTSRSARGWPDSCCTRTPSSPAAWRWPRSRFPPRSLSSQGGGLSKPNAHRRRRDAAGSRHGARCRRRRRWLGRAVPARHRARRRRVRALVHGRAAPPERLDSGRPAQRGDVGLLRRRVPVAVAARDRRRAGRRQRSDSPRPSSCSAQWSSCSH